MKISILSALSLCLSAAVAAPAESMEERDSQSLSDLHLKWRSNWLDDFGNRRYSVQVITSVNNDYTAFCDAFIKNGDCLNMNVPHPDVICGWVQANGETMVTADVTTLNGPVGYGKYKACFNSAYTNVVPGYYKGGQLEL